MARKYGKNSKKPIKKIMRKLSKSKQSFKRSLVPLAFKPELKRLVYTWGIQRFNSLANSAADIQYIMPPIVKGVSQGERIGNVIYMQKLTLRLVYTWRKPESVQAYARIGTRSIVYHDRVCNSANFASSTTLSYILQNASSGYPMTYAQDTWLMPVNRSRVKCKKDLKMVFTNTVQSTSSGYSPPDTSVRVKNIKFGKMKLRFDETTNYPLNFPWSIIHGWTVLDGDVLPSSTDDFLEVTAVATVDYYDP